MTTAYTSLLGLALPVTGELNGTWGDVVNNSITNLLDSAIAGTTTLSTDADVTLTTTTGSANQAREAILLCSGARTAARNITAPAQSKIYTVINATTGGYAVTIRGVGPTTGITIPAGQSAMVAWNGSDFIDASNYINGNLKVNGSVTLSAGTANGVAYLNGSKVVTTGSAFVFDGTNVGVGLTPSIWTTGRAIELGTSAGNAIVGYGTNDLELFSNVYYNSGFKFAGTGYASRLDIGNASGTFKFYNSTASGTAGNSITWLTTAVLNNDITKGLTSLTLDSISTGTQIGSYMQFNRATVAQGVIGSTSVMQNDTSADFGLQAGAGKYLRFYSENSTSATMTIKNGLIGINTNGPTSALHVVSGGSNPVLTLLGSNYTTGGYLDFYDYVNSTHRGYVGYGSALITGAAITDFGIAPGPGSRLVFGSANGGQIDGFVDSNHNLGWGTSGVVSGLVGGIQVGNAVGTASSYNPAPVVVGFQSTTGGVPNFVGNWTNTGWWGIGSNAGTAVAQVRIGNVAITGSGAAFTSGYPVLMTGGINFSNTSNTIYDYEEGTWTVTDQSGAGLTFTFATGVYRKVGTLVYVQIDLQFPATGSAAQAVFSLPYTAKTTVNDGSSGGGASNYFAGAGISQAYVGSNSARANIYYSTGGVSSPMPNSLASNKEISFAFCYHTDS